MRHGAFLRKLLNRRTALVIGLLLLISIWCDRLWILQYPGVVLMQRVDREKTPVEAKHVVMVTITPDEYSDKKLFDNRSPLSATKLSEAVDKILTLKPRVLAIDTDTSDKSFSWFREKYSHKSIVWGRGVTLSEGSLQPGGFAGGEGQSSVMSGIAGFERAPDWAVRNLDQCLTVGGKQIPTFHHVIYLASKGLGTYACENRETRALPGVRYRFPELTLTEVEAAADANQTGEENLLSGKIVLLGGVYSVADYHPGPNGSVIPGIELVASAVEAEFAEARLSENWEWVCSLLVDVALGVFIIWIYTRRGPGLRKLGLSLALAIFFLFVPGVLLYYFGIWSLNPFPLAFGLILHQMYEAAEGGEEAGKERVLLRHTTTTTVSEEESIRVATTEE